MVISYCISCHNRTYDLKKVLPSVIKSANASPPVEIVILNYNSPDDLEEYIKSIDIPLSKGNEIKHIKYTDRDYYHMAHAKNIAVLSAKGEYVVTSCADMALSSRFFRTVRNIIKETEAPWICASYIEVYPGILVFQKKEFVNAGGFDERFEFYGPEDKDLIKRFKRRKLRNEEYPYELLYMIRTSNKDKIKNYRLKISKMEMKKRMRPIYEKNIKDGVLTANPDGWGVWEI